MPQDDARKSEHTRVRGIQPITHDVKNALMSTVVERPKVGLVGAHRSITGIRTLSDHEIQGQDVEGVGHGQILSGCDYGRNSVSKPRGRDELTVIQLAATNNLYVPSISKATAEAW